MLQKLVETYLEAVSGYHRPSLGEWSALETFVVPVPDGDSENGVWVISIIIDS